MLSLKTMTSGKMELSPSDENVLGSKKVMMFKKPTTFYVIFHICVVYLASITPVYLTSGHTETASFQICG